MQLQVNIVFTCETKLHVFSLSCCVATTKGCNLFGLESCSSKWSADNSPEVSFKRVPLFNYFLRDLRRQCDNETVSFTCGSDPPQPDTQSQIVVFTESFPFTLTQQIHLTDFSVGVGPEQLLTFLLNAIELNGSVTDQVVSFPANMAKKTGVKVLLLPLWFVSFLTRRFLYES